MKHWKMVLLIAVTVAVLLGEHILGIEALGSIWQLAPVLASLWAIKVALKIHYAQAGRSLRTVDKSFSSLMGTKEGTAFILYNSYLVGIENSELEKTGDLVKGVLQSVPRDLAELDFINRRPGCLPQQYQNKRNVRIIADRRFLSGPVESVGGEKVYLLGLDGVVGVVWEPGEHLRNE